jgi:tetratricopeptide (TPR) repeat protein
MTATPELLERHRLLRIVRTTLDAAHSWGNQGRHENAARRYLQAAKLYRQLAELAPTPERAKHYTKQAELCDASVIRHTKEN